ncbi:MAG TPA: precorrin-2 C(20)-methyltransferase [Streptosporangiaceae bacterium]|nr:precorrin-2 C(20)-methyltransferase [Streptosporangiaceae bacterium]
MTAPAAGSGPAAGQAPAPGRLTGVGVGPGDPDLLTVRAIKAIAAADVVAYHCARHGNSIARAAAAPYLPSGVIEEILTYPVTTEGTSHPGGYAGALADFYAEATERLAAHLDRGRNVVVLCEGDPAFYGSYQHLHTRLSGRFSATVVPGISSVSAAAAAVGVPLVQHDETLTVLPGTLADDELRARMARADAVAVFKLGRTFDRVRAALADTGLLHRARYVERAGTGAQRVEALADVDPASVPYMSLALVPGRGQRATAGASRGDSGAVRQATAAPQAAGGPGSEDPARAAQTAGAAQEAVTGCGAGPAASRGTGRVVVVGLGPGDPGWLTPEAEAAVAGATDLVGYRPYLTRIPERAGQRRHASGNTVEARRAALALDLAAGGAQVAVISSGDPGVFAMASAVIEQVAAEPDRWPDVPVEVLPGVTAAQAVAARAGAPLGHDYCVISLSDRLKPWETITDRIEKAAAADLAMAFYNPSSRGRTWQLAAVRDLLLRYRDPETPVVLGRGVGRDGERLTVTSLGTLDPADVDMSTLVIVGSSQTRVHHRRGGPVVFTPRHYGEEGAAASAASARPRGQAPGQP